MPWAEEIALAFRGKITAFSVLDQIPHWSDEEELQSLKWTMAARRAKYMEALVQDLAVNGVNAKRAIVRGEPSQTIVDYARKNYYDLIAMSTHGQTGITRWLYGRVADWVVHNTPTPLLLVRPETKARKAPQGPLKRVVVPLDGSKAAEEALDYGNTLALALKLELHLVRVVKPVVLGGVAYGAYWSPDHIVGTITSLQAQADEYLAC